MTKEELEDQLNAIVADVLSNMVQEIVRLLDRDDIEVPRPETPKRLPPPTKDPVLAGFLGVDK